MPGFMAEACDLLVKIPMLGKADSLNAAFDALVRIIANKDDIANGKIYNIGNPVNNYSVRELATMMLDTAATMPE